MDFSSSHKISFLKTAASFCESIDNPSLANHFRKTLYDQIEENSKCVSNLNADGTVGVISVKSKPHKYSKDEAKKRKFLKEKLKIVGLNKEISLIRKKKLQKAQKFTQKPAQKSTFQKPVKKSKFQPKKPKNDPKPEQNSKPGNMLSQFLVSL